jgi:hypothetical protein
MRGVPCSEVTKAKISVSMTGKKRRPTAQATKDLISERLTHVWWLKSGKPDMCEDEQENVRERTGDDENAEE